MLSTTMEALKKYNKPRFCWFIFFKLSADTIKNDLDLKAIRV